MSSDSISQRRTSKTKRPVGGGRVEVSTGEQNTASEATEQASKYIAAGVERVRDEVVDVTRGREGMMVAVALAVGFGMGIAIGTTLAAPRRRPASWKDRLMAEGIGQRVMERMEAMLPQSLTDYLSK
jgi:hypothetical protein